MILVTFAVPQESRDFIRRLRHCGPLGPALVGNLGLEEVAVVHTGMGGAAAREAMHHALAALRPHAALAAGFAGGLAPGLAAGQLIAAENLSTPALLERLPAAVRRVRLASVATPLETPEQKARARAATGADAADLESTAIAAACAEASTPLLVLRIISDAADEPLPLPSATAYDFSRQRLRPLAILAHLNHHPATFDSLAHFAHRLPVLQHTLAEALLAAIGPRH